MNMRIAGIVQDSIVDGEGIRLTVFTQGCPHRCPGCHNPETHDFNGGRMIDTSEIIAMLDANPLLDGVTLSGGEPFCQPEACKVIADAAYERGLNVWCYTGFTWEALVQRACPQELALLNSIDVLVDGRYMEEQRTLELPFRGSRNQRIIVLRNGKGSGGDNGATD